MIGVTIYKNADGRIYGFKVKNHGPGIVCAAVSALVINAVNSIEAFAETKAVIKHSDGGYISLELPDIKAGGDNEKAELLLDSMVLGLKGIAGEYKGTIRITTKG